MDNPIKIIITRTNWYFCTTNYSEIINPLNYQLTIDQELILLKNYKKQIDLIFQILEDNKLNQVYIELIDTNTGICFAELNPDTNLPSHIVLDLRILTSIDDFNFTLGHEVAHYINPYKKFIFNTINPKLWIKIQYIIFSIILLVLFSLDFFIIKLVIKITPQGSITQLLLLFFSFTLLYFTNPIKIVELILMARNHWEEYWCDMFSQNLFQPNITNTFLGKYSDTDPRFVYYNIHYPKYKNRISHLKIGFKRFEFVVPNYD